MNRAAALFAASLVLGGCVKYRDFTLPPFGGPPEEMRLSWSPLAQPVLGPGPAGSWDSVDVLNPSVTRTARGLLNLYSGFDGKTWRTGSAISTDGIAWIKQGVILSPGSLEWEGDYIAANGFVIQFRDRTFYFYQGGRTARIGLAIQSGGDRWEKHTQPVLDVGPYGSWDERGVADPYLIQAAGRLYLFYTGMDRARRQRLGVAVSADGVQWFKLRSNPILELGAFNSFDENGLGEPAVFAAHGSYWMLYTGRSHTEHRRLGVARSQDGVHWRKLPNQFAGNQPWNIAVLCDPTVLIENGKIRLWFGGGDMPRPDENLHGRIGYAELTLTNK